MPTPSPTSGGVSPLHLKLSYWYVNNKIKLRKLLIVFLILISVALYGYSIYRAIDIFFISGKNYASDVNSLTVNAIDYQQYHQTQKPKQLTIDSFDALDGRDGRYDFIAKFSNSNENFVGRIVTFQLVAGNKVIAEKNTYIFPKESKYIGFFGVETGGESPTLKLSKVDWQRVSDFAPFASNHLNFEISNVKFTPAGQAGIRGQLPISNLNFTITNKTAYSYWHVGLYMILQGGSKPAGANYTTIDEFKSGESRDIEMRWYEPLAPVGGEEILPEVDILNPDSFMNPQ